MGRRDRQVVTITTLGAEPGHDTFGGSGPLGGPLGRRRIDTRRPRMGLGGALALGLGVLLVYAVFSLIFHLVAAAALWIPSAVVAGYAAGIARRAGLTGWPRLALAVVVLVAVHVGLEAAVHAL